MVRTRRHRLCRLVKLVALAEADEVAEIAMNLPGRHHDRPRDRCRIHNREDTNREATSKVVVISRADMRLSRRTRAAEIEMMMIDHGGGEVDEEEEMTMTREWPSTSNQNCR